MNLALADIRHSLGRFLLTCVGLGLLMAVALSMVGICQGVVTEALALSRSLRADLWVVEAGTRGPFAESSRLPGDVREMVRRVPGVADAGSVTLMNAEARTPQGPLRVQVIGYEPGRPGAPSAAACGPATR
jgi:putative ABC transport system permease protein